MLRAFLSTSQVWHLRKADKHGRSARQPRKKQTVRRLYFEAMEQRLLLTGSSCVTPSAVPAVEAAAQTLEGNVDVSGTAYDYRRFAAQGNYGHAVAVLDGTFDSAEFDANAGQGWATAFASSTLAVSRVTAS